MVKKMEKDGGKEAGGDAPVRACRISMTAQVWVMRAKLSTTSGTKNAPFHQKTTATRPRTVAQAMAEMALYRMR
jgi:hypothetical protein